MTTSKPARKPKARQADAGTSPGTVRRATPRGDAKTAPPDDVEAQQREVEQAREQLGATVEQLAAKADVRARARDKATELTGRAKKRAERTRAQAVSGAGTVRDQLASKTGHASQKARSVTEQVSGRLASAGTPVREATPEPVRLAVAKGASSARQYRAPLAAVAGALMAGYLVGRSRRKR
jgi:Protein of unknown function (DUF3618)